MKILNLTQDEQRPISHTLDCERLFFCSITNLHLQFFGEVTSWLSGVILQRHLEQNHRPTAIVTTTPPSMLEAGFQLCGAWVKVDPRGSHSRSLGPGLGLGQMLCCINPAAGGFLRISEFESWAWPGPVWCHSSCGCKGHPLFPCLDHSLDFSSFLFISPFHSWLFSSASAFWWENRGDAARSSARSRPHTLGCWPRAGRWVPATTAECRAQNPPLKHIIRVICIAICHHKFSARSIYWLYQEKNNCTKPIKYQSVNQK